jgi:hypothetical protein
LISIDYRHCATCTRTFVDDVVVTNHICLLVRTVGRCADRLTDDESKGIRNNRSQDGSFVENGACCLAY